MLAEDGLGDRTGPCDVIWWATCVVLCRSSSFPRVSPVEAAAALSGKAVHGKRYHSASSEGSFEDQHSDPEEEGCVSTLHSNQRRRSPVNPQSKDPLPLGSRSHRVAGSASPEHISAGPGDENVPTLRVIAYVLLGFSNYIVFLY